MPNGLVLIYLGTRDKGRRRQNYFASQIRSRQGFFTQTNKQIYKKHYFLLQFKN